MSSQSTHNLVYLGTPIAQEWSLSPLPQQPRAYVMDDLKDGGNVVDLTWLIAYL